MRAAALFFALILTLAAAPPAAAACPIEVRVENRGSGALELLPEAWDSGVHVLEDGADAAGGPGGFEAWDAATTLEPGASAVQVAEDDAGCGAERRFQMAYRCLSVDVKGVTFARYPPADGAAGSVTIPLTRCE